MSQALEIKGGMPDQLASRTAPGWPWRAVDVDFDAAVMTIARTVVPGGWDVADDAPSTFEQLSEHLATGRRMVVWSGASGLTIYGSPEVNFAFRAWHDWLHWQGNHPFTFEGETMVGWTQVEQLRKMFGHHPRLRQWQAYLFAEVIGQVMYAELNGGFPGNQRQFAQRLVDVLLDQQARPPRLS